MNENEETKLSMYKAG